MTGFKFNQSQDTILQPCPYSYLFDSLAPLGKSRAVRASQCMVRDAGGHYSIVRATKYQCEYEFI